MIKYNNIMESKVKRWASFRMKHDIQTWIPYVGGGYDGKSGKFTATFKGLYLFSTRVDTIQGKRIHIALVKNGKITSVAWSLHDTATITESLILLPQKIEVKWVAPEKVRKSSFTSGSRRVTFFLLQIS
jgi:hypothetical protein